MHNIIHLNIFNKDKKPGIEKPKSFIRIDSKEHNLAALLDLPENNNIKVRHIAAQNPDPDVIIKITKDTIPMTRPQIEVLATYDEVKRALESNDEFREHIDKLLGSA